ncbi:PqqD family protein [Megasphaera massiliensis]|uniref:PqqD family protein n=2 Tax=Megasphaera massiliensis TaxID=1232428 RepID=UPI0036F303B6
MEYKVVYDWIKDKKPLNKALKSKDNQDLLIVCSSSLDIYYFNTTAALILKAANGKNTVDEIKKMFLMRFEVDESQLETDLVDTIRDLQWKNLIVLEA